MSDADTFNSSETTPPMFQSRMAKPAFIAALIIYFLYLILSRTPASLAAWAVHQAVPTLWFTSINGTLWEGHGGAQVDMGRKTIPLGQVRWSLNPWSLLILRPCLSFETQVPGQMISGSFCQSLLGSTSVEDLNIEIPISLINQLLPVDKAVGDLSIQIVNADLSGQKVNELDARFSWQNASIYVEEMWFTLGSFGGQAQPDGDGGITAKIFDISGPFGVDMQSGWTPGQESWSISGNVTPRNNADGMIVEALRAFGEDVGGGAFKVSWP